MMIIMRLRTLFATISMLLLLGSGCTNHPSTPQPGVALELAQQRKATIHDLRYDLHFRIPHSLTESVICDIAISFTLSERCDVVLDFRDTERITSLRYGDIFNAEVWQEWLTKEHITIPRDLVTVGENTIYLTATPSDQSLNRNAEYLYTLLVPDRARTLFPCFDQPDMKATYTLRLTLPESWSAVSNTAPVAEGHDSEGYKWVTFAPTEPLSTYLFSFVAGKLQSRSYDDGTHRFTAYHRETDPRRVAQLDDIFREVKYALEWLEEYTAIAYPFAKYDLIMLPGFQYGGMEHTGATLYNASQMFLGENPTLDELLRRSSVIAHETAHMWFGDYVTMRWFDDVWTKEVFANYFAARIVEPLYPSINHALSRLKSYTIASLSEDRTAGSTPIRQHLDNLQDAGLIYGRIIYNKAPIVMDKMVEIMGDDSYREGIRDYLRRYGYGNASWPELIAILDGYTTADLATFSQAWVHSNAMPVIECHHEANTLTITQRDPLGRGTLWPQSFALDVLYADNTTERLEITLHGERNTLTLKENITHIIPNSDGRGYGLFIPSSEDISWLLESLPTLHDDLTREATLINLHELYKWEYLDAQRWIEALIAALGAERNYLVASTICDYLTEPLITLRDHTLEVQLWDITTTHPITSLRRKLVTTLAHATTAESVTTALYNLWQQGSASWLGTLDTEDAMTLAYELSLRLPQHHKSIIATQRGRIENPDRLAKFDYISRGTSPDMACRDALFAELLTPEARRTEPWAAALLRLLNHHTRQAEALKYILPGLEEVREIQRTGDIFFPSNWCKALLDGHHSPEARAIVERFLADNPDYPALLRSKILQAMR